jgi:hypothetical protein
VDIEDVSRQKRRTSILSELKDNPSWAELQRALDDYQARKFAAFSRRLIAGEEVDQRYIDRLAGFFIGAQWILDNPDLNEQKLEAKLRKAELLGLLEGEVIA